MISVNIIGYGNVAHHLISAFLEAKNIQIKQVYARSINKIKHLEKKTEVIDDLDLLKPADVTIIAIKDNAIAKVSNKIKQKKTLVVHTSGATPMAVLKNIDNKGVFYPLQSFSINKLINFSEIPICIETEHQKDYKVLEQLAKTLSKKVYKIDSSQRKKIHVAAVFVNNFVNHLYTITDNICKKNDIPFEILFPLINETTSKIKNLPPKLAQTGPAVRNDQTTINNHLKLLTNKQKEIYTLLTQSIQDEHKL